MEELCLLQLVATLKSHRLLFIIYFISNNNVIYIDMCEYEITLCISNHDKGSFRPQLVIFRLSHGISQTFEGQTIMLNRCDMCNLLSATSRFADSARKKPACGR